MKPSRPHRCIAAIAVFAGVNAVSSDGTAAPSARLIYLRDAAAASCPDERVVRAAVAARLGYDPFLTYATATMLAEIRHAGTTFTASIKLIDEQHLVRGARELVISGKPCSELVDAMALSMSIAIDPLSLAGPRPPVEAPSIDSTPAEVVFEGPTTSAAVEPAEPPKMPASLIISRPTMPAFAAPTRTALHLDVGAGVLIHVGTAPAPAVGAQLAGYLHIGRASIAAELRADLPATRAFSQGSVGTSLTVGTVGVCYNPGPWFGCAVGSLGALTASGIGISAPRSDTAAYSTVGLRAGAEVRLAPAFALRMHVEGATVLTAHRLIIDGNPAYTLPILAGSAGISAVARIF